MTIMAQNLIFSCLCDGSTGVLGVDDLRFFYYDVGLDNFTGSPAMYGKTKEVDDFITKQNLDIRGVEALDLSTTFIDGQVLFTKMPSEASDYEALFRHLRNAFAHYHILRKNDYFFMNDYSNESRKELSMTGKIKCDDLVELCYLFFDQRSKMEKEIYKTEEI